VVQDILPTKARSEVNRLLTELQDAQFKLEIQPTTTIEYVESLTLLDEIHERVSLKCFISSDVIVGMGGQRGAVAPPSKF